MFPCVFTEERIESCHTVRKHKSVECCSDVCPSVSFFHLHIWLWSSTRVTNSFLVTSKTKPLVHQFDQEASSRKSPSCSKCHPLWIMEACFCEPSMQCNRIFSLNSSPDVWLDASLFLSSTGSYFDLRAWFFSDMLFQLLDLLLRGMCLSKTYSFKLI